MKPEVEIKAWDGLDLAQIWISIVMFLSLHTLILHQMLQSRAWILPNDDQETRICNKNHVLLEEFLNYDGEKFWRENLDLDLEWSNLKSLLGLSFYMLC